MFQFGIRRIFLILGLLFLTVGCDQVTKIVVRDTLAQTRPISYLNNSITLQHAENPGAFLSLGSSLSEDLRFLIFTAMVAVVLLVSFGFLIYSKKLSKWATIGLTLIVAGGVGNLVDRILFGTVTDFIHLKLGPVQTGIFNIADVAIVAGAILLLVRRSSVDSAAA